MTHFTKLSQKILINLEIFLFSPVKRSYVIVGDDRWCNRCDGETRRKKIGNQGPFSMLLIRFQHVQVRNGTVIVAFVVGDANAALLMYESGYMGLCVCCHGGIPAAQ